VYLLPMAPDTPRFSPKTLSCSAWGAIAKRIARPVRVDWRNTLRYSALRAKPVGWVERYETHRVTMHAKQADGFRKRSTHPTS
jgi:hypothetical protein